MREALEGDLFTRSASVRDPQSVAAQERQSRTALENTPFRIIKSGGMESLRISRLTERQRLCLRHVHAHLSSKEIATRVGIGPGTVDQHIKAAMLVLGVCDRRSAARMLVEHEAATSEPPVETPLETAPAAWPTDNVMSEMLASIRHGLGNVLNFSGRDTREQFRRYAIFLLVLGGAVAYLIVETRSVMALMRWVQAAAANPEQAGNIFQWKRDHPELLSDLSDLPFILAVVTSLHFTLIAAAVARRRHDWTRTEVWGFLSLPVANVALMMKPAMISPILGPASLVGFLYVFIRGGAPERVLVAISVVGTSLSFLALSGAPLRVAGVQISVLVTDCAGTLGYILLALLANRFWPIWVAALNCLALATHLIVLMNPMVDPSAYAIIAAGGVPLTMMVVIIGTRNHQLRLRQYGVDPAWSPLGRNRRAVKPPAREEEQGIGAKCIGA